MIQHDPVVLSPNERIELASITKHPGMTVLVEKILAGHAKKELESVYEVKLDDPDRVTKISAICASAYASKLMVAMAIKELDYNWNILQEQEKQNRKPAKAGDDEQ